MGLTSNAPFYVHLHNKLISLSRSRSRSKKCTKNYKARAAIVLLIEHFV